MEFIDIDVPVQPWVTDHPVMDVKLRNRWVDSAVLTRMTVEVVWACRFSVLDDLMPAVDTSGPLKMDPSATYDVKLPHPQDAAGVSITVAISHVIAPGDGDRFEVRLITDFQYSETSVYSQPDATSVYLLRLHLASGAGQQRLSSRTVAVACPGNVLFLPTGEDLRRSIRRFWDKVTEIRQVIDFEMQSSRQDPPDWPTRPPRRREDLPPGLARLDGYRVNERFWNPERAIAVYLDEAERGCSEIAANLSADMPDGLGEAIGLARRTIGEIPALRLEFGGPS